MNIFHLLFHMSTSQSFLAANNRFWILPSLQNYSFIKPLPSLVFISPPSPYHKCNDSPRELSHLTETTVISLGPRHLHSSPSFPPPCCPPPHLTTFWSCCLSGAFWNWSAQIKWRYPTERWIWKVGRYLPQDFIEHVEIQRRWPFFCWALQYLRHVLGG